MFSESDNSDIEVPPKIRNVEIHIYNPGCSPRSNDMPWLKMTLPLCQTTNLRDFVDSISFHSLSKPNEHGAASKIAKILNRLGQEYTDPVETVWAVWEELPLCLIMAAPAPEEVAAAVTDEVAAAATGEAATPRAVQSAARWTAAEDQILLSAKQAGKSYSQIQAEFFPAKTAGACKKRNYRLMHQQRAPTASTPQQTNSLSSQQTAGPPPQLHSSSETNNQTSGQNSQSQSSSSASTGPARAIEVATARLAQALPGLSYLAAHGSYLSAMSASTQAVQSGPVSGPSSSLASENARTTGARHPLPTGASSSSAGQQQNSTGGDAGDDNNNHDGSDSEPDDEYDENDEEDHFCWPGCACRLGCGPPQGSPSDDSSDDGGDDDMDVDKDEDSSSESDENDQESSDEDGDGNDDDPPASGAQQQEPSNEDGDDATPSGSQQQEPTNQDGPDNDSEMTDAEYEDNNEEDPYPWAGCGCPLGCGPPRGSPSDDESDDGGGHDKDDDSDSETDEEDEEGGDHDGDDGSGDDDPPPSGAQQQDPLVEDADNDSEMTDADNEEDSEGNGRDEGGSDGGPLGCGQRQGSPDQDAEKSIEDDSDDEPLLLPAGTTAVPPSSATTQAVINKLALHQHGRRQLRHQSSENGSSPSSSQDSATSDASTQVGPVQSSNQSSQTQEHEVNLDDIVAPVSSGATDDGTTGIPEQNHASLFADDMHTLDEQRGYTHRASSSYVPSSYTTHTGDAARPRRLSLPTLIRVRGRRLHPVERDIIRQREESRRETLQVLQRRREEQTRARAQAEVEQALREQARQRQQELALLEQQERDARLQQDRQQQLAEKEERQQLREKDLRHQEQRLAIRERRRKERKVEADYDRDQKRREADRKWAQQLSPRQEARYQRRLDAQVAEANANQYELESTGRAERKWTGIWKQQEPPFSAAGNRVESFPMEFASEPEKDTANEKAAEAAKRRASFSQVAKEGNGTSTRYNQRMTEKKPRSTEPRPNTPPRRRPRSDKEASPAVEMSIDPFTTGGRRVRFGEDQVKYFEEYKRPCLTSSLSDDDDDEEEYDEEMTPTSPAGASILATEIPSSPPVVEGLQATTRHDSNDAATGADNEEHAFDPSDYDHSEDNDSLDSMDDNNMHRNVYDAPIPSVDMSDDEFADDEASFSITQSLDSLPAMTKYYPVVNSPRSIYPIHALPKYLESSSSSSSGEHRWNMSSSEHETSSVEECAAAATQGRRRSSSSSSQGPPDNASPSASDGSSSSD